MEKLKDYWLDFLQDERGEENWWDKKKDCCEKRDAKIVRVEGKGHLFRKFQYENQIMYEYKLHLSYLIRQKEKMYMEEEVIPYTFKMKNGAILEHKRVENKKLEAPTSIAPNANRNPDEERLRFSYDRLAAVQYAERWWNSYNPDFRKFEVDCTNYVSQCLLAGGAPMRGAPVRERGWWYNQDNWSFSWAVAHSLRWYLSGSTDGLQGKEVSSAEELAPGDVICYDFQGDGRWDHNTIVVTKDAAGMPLVNAHTSNSRNRYWSYEDSTAWTPNIQYKFFRIGS
ncbi:amidase domain-containing protein [Oceanobacillus manasiensis]|uniref:amidase domain-containing protein n=1 Tax=Oceanobacillus manasiensis TaxID=586413 RepID=UPI0005AA002E|nr:amidase domain-containing protein [Oceanobacillus manasiensis]